MTVKIFTNMPFPWLHIFNKKCLFKTIADKVVNSWNSSSIITLLFTNFLIWEFSCLILSFSLFVENGGKMYFYPLYSSNTEKLRALRKNSQIKKLAYNYTIMVDKFKEFTTLSAMVLNRHFLLKICNRGKGIFVNIFTVKLL